MCRPILNTTGWCEGYERSGRQTGRPATIRTMCCMAKGVSSDLSCRRSEIWNFLAQIKRVRYIIAKALFIPSPTKCDTEDMDTYIPPPPPTRRRHQPPAKWRRIEVATPLRCFGCCGSGFKYYTLWVLQILIWLGTRWLVAEGQAGRMMQKDIISHRRPPPRAVWMTKRSEDLKRGEDMVVKGTEDVLVFGLLICRGGGEGRGEGREGRNWILRTGEAIQELFFILIRFPMVKASEGGWRTEGTKQGEYINWMSLEYEDCLLSRYDKINAGN